MGTTIYAKKGKGIDLGGGGFWNLRTKVAELCSPEFGEHYKTLDDGFRLCGEPRREFFKKFDEETARLIKEKKVHYKVASFCLQPDCDGKVGYGACKIIYEHIRDYDDDILYGYCGRPDCAMFKDFKEIVKQCIDLKCDLVWN